VSNFSTSHVDRLVRGTGATPAVNQLEVQPYFQQRGVRDHLREMDIVIQGYSPLGGCGSGILRSDIVRDIAAKHVRSAAQTVIRWHLRQGLAPLPKTATAARIPENLAVWNFELDDHDIARLGKLDRANGNTQPLPDSINSPFRSERSIWTRPTT